MLRASFAFYFQSSFQSGFQSNMNDAKKSPLKDVDGYFHNVSDVVVPVSGHRYFDFTEQEKVEERRVF